MAANLERMTRDYWRAVLRIRRMAVPEAEKRIVLADVEVIFRRERAAALSQLDVDPTLYQST